MGTGGPLTHRSQPADSAAASGPGAARFDQHSGAPARSRSGQTKGQQAIGRSRGGRTSKLHLGCDGAGNVLNWRLTPGQAGYCLQAAWVLAPHLAAACEVVADTAYDSDALRGLIACSGAVAVIAPTPRRRNVPHCDPGAYAKRHHVEQTFNKLKQHRRLATRYDNLDASFEAFLCARIFTLYLN
ncbi:IS5 family transposase [Hymenobacter psychrophilus]|uniref:Transposase n=1 Tax=Hymenobacter psychrophilus TaxID=651662 RepID=A0A1H3LCC6_9BACT|nr:Transposase [Hymenobacter psychrophilus]